MVIEHSGSDPIYDPDNQCGYSYGTGIAVKFGNKVIG